MKEGSEMTCVNCGCEMTPDLESPEKDCCGVCLIYLQDIRQENERRARTVVISREMARDAGFPEMEGMEMEW